MKKFLLLFALLALFTTNATAADDTNVNTADVVAIYSIIIKGDVE